MPYGHGIKISESSVYIAEITRNIPKDELFPHLSSHTL